MPKIFVYVRLRTAPAVAGGYGLRRNGNGREMKGMMNAVSIGPRSKAAKGGVMKILWIVTMVFLLSVVGYSGLSGAPLKPPVGAVALDASSAISPGPVQTAALAETARDVNNDATGLSAYLQLHKTRDESGRGGARANTCVE